MIYCRDILFQLVGMVASTAAPRLRKAPLPVPPSALRSRKIDGWTVLGDWDLAHSPEKLARLNGEGRMLSQDRVTSVRLLDGLVIKHRRDSLLLRLRQMPIRSICLREHAALARMSAAGLRTPKPLGAAARFKGPILLEDMLVTSFEPGMTNLGYTRRAGLSIDRSIAMLSLAGLAKDLRRVHDGGLYVNTLADRNVLVGPGGRYVVLDLDFAGRWGRREFDLGFLDKGLSRTLSRTDRLRLLSAYLGEGATAAERRELVKRVARMEHRIHKKGRIATWGHSLNRRLRRLPWLQRHLR